MNDNEENQTPLNTPASGVTPAAPIGQKADSKASGKQPEATPEAQPPSQDQAHPPTQGEARVPVPAATPPVKQDVDSLKQAAQSEHKPSTDGVSDPTGSKDCAHAGGRSPQTPKPINKLKSAVKRRSKKRDNHVSVRCQDDEMDVIEERMTSTGETQSEAVRAIILEYKNKEGNVYLQPKTPIEQLEELLGLLGDWRRDFKKVQSKLNMPTPTNDEKRHEQVVEWREKTKELLILIPRIEKLIQAVINASTSLTLKKVEHLRANIPFLKRLYDECAAKGSKAAMDLYGTFLELIDDMGIKPKP